MIGTNNFWLDIILLIISASFLILFSYTIGILLFNVQSTTKERKAFYNTTLGLLLIIDIFSCFYTGFKTVNLISLLLLSYLSVQNKYLFKFANIDLKSLRHFLFIIPIIFVLVGIFILPVSIQMDTKFYAKIVKCLTLIGCENFYHFYNNLDLKFNGVIPYHYTEFWLAALFNKFTGSLSIYSLRYFAYPLLISLVSFGVLTSIASKRLFLLFILFISLSLCSIGTYISFYDIGWDVIMDFWNRPNLLMYYITFALLYGAILDNNWKLFYIFSSISLTFSVLIIPSIIPALFLLNIYTIYIKEITLKQALINLTIPFFSVLGILLIYKLFGVSINTSTDFDIKESLLNNLKIWKAIVTATTVLIFETSIFIIVYWFYNKRILKNRSINLFIIFIAILVVTGVLLFQILNQIDNAYQFGYFGYSGVGFLFILLVLNLINNIKSSYFRIILIVVCCPILVYPNFNSFNLYNCNKSLYISSLESENVSLDWATKVQNYFHSHSNAKGAFLFSHHNIINYPPKARHCLTLQVGNHISFITDNCNLPSLTCKDTLFYDYTIKNKDAYTKMDTWFKTFPNYTKDCDPENYLINYTFDYFICHIDYPIKNKQYGIITDTLKNLKMVYVK